MPPKKPAKAKEEAIAVEEEPEQRDPFFETTRLHACLLVTKYTDQLEEEEGDPYEIEDVKKAILANQDLYKETEAEKLKEEKEKKAEREAAFAAGEPDPHPPPPPPEEKPPPAEGEEAPPLEEEEEKPPPPSIFSKHVFRTIEYDEVKKQVIGLAGTWKDALGAGQMLKDAFEASTEEDKPADISEWNLSVEHKSLVLKSYIESEYMQNLREEEDRRLGVIKECEEAITAAKEFLVTQETACQEAYTVAEEAANAIGQSLAPPKPEGGEGEGGQAADGAPGAEDPFPPKPATPPVATPPIITPEMKQAARETQAAWKDAKTQVELAQKTIERREADLAEAEEKKVLPFSISLVVFPNGFAETMEEIAAMNVEGASFQGLAWIKKFIPPVPEGEEGEEGLEGEGGAPPAPKAAAPPPPKPAAAAPPAPDPKAKPAAADPKAKGGKGGAAAAPEPTEEEEEEVVEDGPRPDPPLVAELKSLQETTMGWTAGVRQVALLDVDYMLPEPEEPSEENPEPAEPPSLMQVLTDSLLLAANTVMEQLSHYQGWKEKLLVVEVPEAPGLGPEDLDVYNKLLDGVAPENLTVPVILHCLMEQCAFSCLDPAEVVQADQLKAEAEAIRNIERMFAEVVGGKEGPKEEIDPEQLIKEKAAGELEKMKLPPLMHEADRVKLNNTFSAAARPAPELQINVVEVEEKMMSMLLLPGVNRYKMPAEKAMNPDEVDRQNTSMAAYCKDGITLDHLQRYLILKEAVGCMPKNAQAAHGDAIMERSHLENFPLASFAQTYIQAVEQFPECYMTYFGREDALLVALCASEAVVNMKEVIPRALPFCDWWSLFASEGFKTPEPLLEVYTLEANECTVERNTRHVYTADSALTRSALPKETSVVTPKMTLALRNQVPACPLFPDGKLFARKEHKLKKAEVVEEAVEVDADGHPVEKEAEGAEGLGATEPPPGDKENLNIFGDGEGEEGAGPAEVPPPPPPRQMAFVAYDGVYVTVTTEEAEPEKDILGNPILPSEDLSPEEIEALQKPKLTRMQIVTRGGVVTEMTSSGSILQGHSIRSKQRPFLQPIGGSTADLKYETAANSELFRCTTVDGCVIRTLENSNLQLLMPNGNVGFRDFSGTTPCWVGTNSKGDMWKQADAYLPRPVTPPPPEEEDPSSVEAAQAEQHPERPGSSSKKSKEDSRPQTGADKKGGKDAKGGKDDKKGKKDDKKDKKEPEHEPEPEPEVEEAPPPPPPPPPPEPVVPPAVAMAALGVTQASDPHTQATVTVRQDLVMSLEYPNGDFCAHFADGTRTSKLPEQGIDWQVECEGLAPVMRKGREVSVDVGQGVLCYDCEEETEDGGLGGCIWLHLPDGGTILARGAQVVYAPCGLVKPRASAKAALALAVSSWAKYQEMVAKHKVWEQKQADYQLALQAHQEEEALALEAIAEFEANPPPAPAEGEDPVEPPPPPPEPPTPPVAPRGLVDPKTLYPPSGMDLGGCYLLDFECAVLAQCDVEGSGFHVDEEGMVTEYGPQQEFLERSVREYEERIEEWHRRKEEEEIARIMEEERLAEEERIAAEKAAKAQQVAEEAVKLLNEAKEKHTQETNRIRRASLLGRAPKNSRPQTGDETAAALAKAEEDAKKAAEEAAAAATLLETAKVARSEHGSEAGSRPGTGRGSRPMTPKSPLAPGVPDIVPEDSVPAELGDVEEEWVFPYAKHLKPRVFVIYPDGRAVEVLDQTAFKLYSDLQEADPQCTVTREPVTGGSASEDGAGQVTAHTFLTQLSHREIGVVKPLTLAPLIPPRPASATRALPALKLPSKVYPPPKVAPLTLPRSIAVPPQPLAPKDQPALKYRQVLEYTCFDEGMRSALNSAWTQYSAWQTETDNTNAETYSVPDNRTEEELEREAVVGAQVLKARAMFEKKVEVMSEEHRESVANTLADDFDQAAEAAAGAAEEFGHAFKTKPTHEIQYPSPFGTLGERPPVQYFAVEEGRAAVQSLAGKSGRFLPPQCLNIPRKSPAALPPMTPEERPPQPILPLNYNRLLPMEGPPGSDDFTFPGSQDTRGFETPGIENGELGEEYVPGEENMYSDGLDGLETFYGAMSEETMEKLQARREARSLDVTGKPRGAPVTNVPKSLRAPQADAYPNWRFHEIEGEARRPLHTTSTELMKHRGMRQQFTLIPAHIHFGRVQVGASVTRVATLSNISPDVGRFFIKPTQPPLRLQYNPGALAAGMALRIEVNMTPRDEGDFCDEIFINTEHHHFTLTVSAKVVPRDEASGYNIEPALSLGPSTKGPSKTPTAAAPASALGSTTPTATTKPSSRPNSHGLPPEVADANAGLLDENATLDEVKARVEQDIMNTLNQ